MISNFEYFTLGLPPDPKDPVYGLYQPMLDCFLVVSPSLDVLKRVSSLLLSRYNTYVCCVSTADNFKPTLIDNSVCANWTLSNPEDCGIEYSLRHADSVKVKKMVRKNKQQMSVWDIEGEVMWILFCIHWATYFERLKNFYFHYYEIDTLLADILPDTEDIGYYPYDLEKQIMQLLFFGSDIEQTNSKIMALVDENPLMNLAWKDINSA